MATPKPWKFTQIGGDRKELILSGPAAPHGRTRQKPVVSDGLKVRQSKTMYSGSSVPTRHVFGTECKDLELSGRWRDADLGLGGARGYVDLMKGLVADQRTVLVTWGDIVVVTGLLVDFEPGRESEQEVAWKLTIEVDTDDTKATPPRPAPVIDPAGSATLVESLLVGFTNSIANPPREVELSPTFLDTLDNAVSSLNGATASLLKAAYAIDNFESATADSLKRLVGGIGQVKTALLTLQGTVDSTAYDAMLLRDSSKSNILWYKTLADAQANSFAVNALLTELGVRAETAQAGSIGRTYTAQRGDTWESLATKFLGGPASAERLRQANGAKYGTQPAAGALLRVPNG